MNGISMSNGLMVGLNRSNISNQSRKLNIGLSKMLRDGSGYEASSYENFGVRTTRGSLNARWVETLGCRWEGRRCWIERERARASTRSHPAHRRGAAEPGGPVNPS